MEDGRVSLIPIPATLVSPFFSLTCAMCSGETAMEASQVTSPTTVCR